MINNLFEEINRVLKPLNPIGPDNIKLDNSIHRFDLTKKGDNAGWVIGSQWVYKNEDQFTATYGSWRQGEKFTWTSWDPNTADRALTNSMRQNTKMAAAELKKEQQKKYKDCRDKWKPVFYGCKSDSETHTYLVEKNITSNFSARVDKWNNLLIPIFNINEEEEVRFVGVQRICPKEDGTGFIKRFSKGIQLKGSFHAFGSLKDSDHVFVCEGWATGASIRIAMRETVAVCFNAGNIVEAILTIRKIKPGIKITVCADRDINKDPKLHDIGYKKARYASKKYSNCIAKRVKFADNNDHADNSDFNDLHCTEGLDPIKEQLKYSDSDFIDIAFLGHHDKRYYYFIKNKKMLLGLTPAEHTKTQLLMMAPGKYWQDNFGYKYDKNGDAVPNWDKAIEKLAIIQGEKGFFNPENIRGVGCWLDQDRLFVNLGDRILINKDDKNFEILPIFDDNIRTKNFYEGGIGVKISLDRTLSSEQGRQIIDAFKLLKFKNPADHTYLVGWIAMAQIYGAIDWRPHLWITGERGTGKTTILELIDRMLPLSLSVTDSTASGIKQAVKNDTRPVVYDESEPDSDKMKPVIQLARQSSSRTNSKVLRGTISGRAMHFNTNVVFCFGSIQKQLFSAADDSRVFAVEMRTLKNQDRCDFTKLQNAMAEIKDLAKPMMLRMIFNFHRFQRCFKTAREAIKDNQVEARQADQLATVLAAYYVLGSDGELNSEWINRKIKELNFLESDYMEANKLNDSEKCLDTILQLTVDNKDNSTVASTIQAIIYAESRYMAEDAEKRLAYLGIRYYRRERELFIAANNIYLKEKLKKHSEYTDYSSLLKRHTDFKNYKTKYLEGRNVKGCILAFLDDDKKVDSDRQNRDN